MGISSEKAKFIPRRKWEATNAIWDAYINTGKFKDVSVPLFRLLIRNRLEIEIDQIFNDLKREGCFETWDRDSNSYHISNINHEVFSDIFTKTRDGYEKTNKVSPSNEKLYAPKEPNPYIKADITEHTFLEFKCWSDGRITYNQTEMKLRAQLKDLFRLLISRSKSLVTYDDIRDTIIHPKKRKKVSNPSLSKYVNELSSELLKYSAGIVITNVPKEGYILNTT